MSIFPLDDGSNPYAGRFPVDEGDEVFDSESDLADFAVAARLLGDFDPERLAQLFLSDPGEIDLPLTTIISQTELPLYAITAPRPPSLPFDAAAPTELPALESSTAQWLTPNLTNAPSPLSIGGPYWGAELSWKRTAQTGKERKANEEDVKDNDGDDETERRRKRRAAWREYHETALERRLRVL